MTLDQLAALAFIVAFGLGLRASFRLTRRYRRAVGTIESRNRPVLRAIVAASWIITIVAGWIGMLSSVRILTDMVLPWTPPITLVLAIAVVFIPVAFDLAIARVAREDKITGRTTDEDAQPPAS